MQKKGAVNSINKKTIGKRYYIWQYMIKYFLITSFNTAFIYEI